MIETKFQSNPLEEVIHYVSKGCPWVVLELTKDWPNAKDFLIPAFSNAASECQRLAENKTFDPSWQALFQELAQDCSSYAQRLSTGELTPNDLLTEVEQAKQQL